MNVKKTKFRRILIVAAAVVMVLGMSSVSFAATGNGYYIVGDPTSTSSPITVKVIIESKQYSETDTTSISETLNVPVSTASSPGDGYTVRDAVLAITENQSTYGIKAYDSNGNQIDSSDTYIYSFEKNGKVYEPALPMSGYELDGWTFRVNGKLPLSSTNGDPYSGGPLGTEIHKTPISNGDIIHFYWDYPYNESASTYYSADYVTADMSYANSSLSIQLKKSFSYFDNNYYWHISDFENLSGGNTGTYNVTVYDETGNFVKAGTISKSGFGTISNCNLQSGKTYYVRVDTTDYRSVDSYDDITWKILKSTMAYEKITVQ